MLDRLRSFVMRGQRAEVVRECRDCGTAVERAGVCPNCGSRQIARYEID